MEGMGGKEKGRDGEGNRERQRDRFIYNLKAEEQESHAWAV